MIKEFYDKDLSEFKLSFIEENRGRSIFLIRFQHIRYIDIKSFVNLTIKQIISSLDSNINFYIGGNSINLYIGITRLENLSEKEDKFSNFDLSLGKLHKQSMDSGKIYFEFGIGRTQCNYISGYEEIFHEIEDLSLKNLRDNLIRWSWSNLKKLNDFFADNSEIAAVIQPMFYYDTKTKSFSIKGGEVFIGGNTYTGYYQLLNDIPKDFDRKRIEILILEKLIISCNSCPGILKINISPQTLLDSFKVHEKVDNFHKLVLSQNLDPKKFRLELIEKPYEEKEITLKEICSWFGEFGYTFAADDFGVKSQSHQVVLDLGELIQEFKLDPISYKFRADKELTKFLDNLAFIDYCKRLSDNRNAIITAEALEDIEELQFLITQQIVHFQTNLLCKKISLTNYKENFNRMQNLPEEIVIKIYTEHYELLKKNKNIFEIAFELKYL